MNIKVRQARRADKGPLMSFIKDVWGGHDYIPYVWDDWLKDKKSKMFVVLADGKQVGMNRVCFMEDGSAWLEGARVHPDFRGLGMATALAEESMREAMKRGARIFRLASGTWNKRAHRHIARIGFKEVSRIRAYVPSKAMRRVTTEGVRRAGAEDSTKVQRMIRNSRDFRLGSGVMWDTFAAIALTGNVVTRALSRGDAYVYGDAVAIARPSGAEREYWRQVCFLAGEGDDAVRIMRHVFWRKERFRTARRIVYVPKGSALIGKLRDAGMERDYSLILFERGAANG